jgi:hypothetical protein
MKQSIILGIDTGRCGMASLAKILNQQSDTQCAYEDPPLLPWRIAMQPSSRSIMQFWEKKRNFFPCE